MKVIPYAVLGLHLPAHGCTAVVFATEFVRYVTARSFGEVPRLHHMGDNVLACAIQAAGMFAKPPSWDLCVRAYMEDRVGEGGCAM